MLISLKMTKDEKQFFSDVSSSEENSYDFFQSSERTTRPALESERRWKRPSTPLGPCVRTERWGGGVSVITS